MRKYLVNATFWAFAGQTLGTFFSFANMAVLSRLISPEQMGNYLLVLSVVMVSSLFGMFGLPETMMRNTANLIGKNEPAKAKATIQATITLVLIFSTTTAVVFFVSPLIDSIESAFKLHVIGIGGLLIALWLVLHCVHTTEIYIFRGLQDIFRASIFGQSMRGALMLLTLTVLGANSAVNSAVDAILANCIALVIAIVVTGVYVRRKIKALHQRADRWPMRKLLMQATPFFVDSVVYQAFIRVGLWLLGYYVTKSEVALYGAAVQMVTLIMFPMQAVNSLLPPIIANQYSKDGDNRSLQKLVRTVTTLVAIPSTILTMIFIFWGGEILALVFGGFYSQGHTILALLSIGYLSNIVLGPVGFLLKMSFHQTDLLKINLVSSLFTILIAAYMAKNHTAEAVAATFAASMILKNIYTLMKAYQKTGITPAILVRSHQYRALLTEASELLGQLRQR